MRRSEAPHQTDSRLDHDGAGAAIGWITVGGCLERIHGEAGPQGDEPQEAHIASGASYERRLPVPPGCGSAAIERNGACSRRDIGKHAMAQRGKLMRPEQVEFIAAYGPRELTLAWHVESPVCRGVGKEDSSVIVAPDLPPIFGRGTPPGAVRLHGFDPVNRLAGRGFGDRAGNIRRKRLIAAGSLAIVGRSAMDGGRKHLIAGCRFAEVASLASGVSTEGVDRNRCDGP